MRSKKTAAKRKQDEHPFSDAELEQDSPPNKRVRWNSKFKGKQDLEECDEDPESSDESTGADKVCLTAVSQNGRVAFAYYDPVKCLIYVLEDTSETPHFELTKTILEQASPDIVLTSSKTDDSFMDTIRDHMETAGGVFQVRPHKEFTPTKGRDRLLSLRLLSELPVEEEPLSDTDSYACPRNAYDFMSSRRRDNYGGDPTSKRWNASIRLANFTAVDSAPLCLSAVGALLDHLVRERALADMDDEGIGGLAINDIETLTLNHVMQINADALFSLQIFDNESHASVHADRTKEGLSLFATLDRTVTALGRSLLRTWCLRPTLSMETIKERHDAVECFLLAENLLSAGVMHTHLKGIKNVPKILGTLRGGKARLTEWQGLVKFAYHSAMLKNTLAELNVTADVVVVHNLLEVLDIASYGEVGRSINDTIDWEESANAGRVCVRQGVDEDLDRRKYVYNGIDDVLSNVAETVSQNVPASFAESLNVVYFPQLGFLVCVPMREEWENGIDVIEGWTFQFSSEASVYFKNQEMHDMDQHLGDLHSAIVDREIEIIQRLLESILVHDKSMGETCHVCAELDCLLSFAEASHALDWRRPDMVQASITEIVKGRHPLQEQVLDTFVPNDARVVAGPSSFKCDDSGFQDDGSAIQRDQDSSVVLITGANACGKSVYIKQIALIQYMAQIGCFVPAESATLGVVDKIFTRIQTRESASKVQSAFMIDLNQVSVALRNCTARSLVLLDEFGKGTISTDGAGLFCGVIKSLLDRGAACPRILAATHFHDVFRPDMLDPETASISFLHMQVMFTSSTGQLLGQDGDEQEEEEGKVAIGPGERITYLYRVAEGVCLDSHAAKCAQLFGIPPKVVERAQRVSHLLATYELGQLLDEEMNDKERQELVEAEDICRRFIAWDLTIPAKVREWTVKERLREVLGRVHEEIEGDVDQQS